MFKGILQKLAAAGSRRQPCKPALLAGRVHNRPDCCLNAAAKRTLVWNAHCCEMHTGVKCTLWNAHCKKHTSKLKTQNAHCKMHTAKCVLQNAHCKTYTTKCTLQNVYCKRQTQCHCGTYITLQNALFISYCIKQRALFTFNFARCTDMMHSKTLGSHWNW